MKMNINLLDANKSPCYAYLDVEDMAASSNWKTGIL